MTDWIWPARGMRKKCRKCGRVKPVEEYYEVGYKWRKGVYRKLSVDGFSARCKECIRADFRTGNLSPAALKAQKLQLLRASFADEEFTPTDARLLLDYTASGMRKIIKDLRDAGEIYAVRWEPDPRGGQPVAFYRFGKGVPAPRPPKKEDAEPMEPTFKVTRKRGCVTEIEANNILDAITLKWRRDAGTTLEMV